MEEETLNGSFFFFLPASFEVVGRVTGLAGDFAAIIFAPVAGPCNFSSGKIKNLRPDVIL